MNLPPCPYPTHVPTETVFYRSLKSEVKLINGLGRNYFLLNMEPEPGLLDGLAVIIRFHFDKLAHFIEPRRKGRTQLCQRAVDFRDGLARWLADFTPPGAS